MTISSSPTQRGLDAAPIIYSLLSGHPGSAICETYIRNHSGWLTTTVTLLEAPVRWESIWPTPSFWKVAELSEFR
jgi:hypothetical protein